MTGIIGAMKIEVDSIKSAMKNTTSETISHIEFIRGTYFGQEVVVAQCGIGKVFAALCAQTMIVRYGVKRMINVGVAGSLCDDLHLLELAVSTAVVEHDMDTSPLGDPVGLISGINRVELPASQPLVRAFADTAASLGKHCVCGVIASGDQFIADAEKKRWIHQTFGAVACEMEGAAIGHVCYVNDVEFVILRAISDNAGNAAGNMEYPELCRRAAEQSGQLLQAFFNR